MGGTLEQMARSLIESGGYRVIRRLEPQTKYHPPDNSPKLVAAIVDVETTGTNAESDKVIELGICLFEYLRHDGRIYKVLARISRESGRAAPERPRGMSPARDRGFADSPLEGDGFEPSVPSCDRPSANS